jgi:3D (Asp-Asp-Asp) domain-containing protein
VPGASVPAPAPPAAPRRPPAAARAPVRILAEVEAAFAAADSGARRGFGRRARALPRPLAELRMAAAPLIMPRLALPRVLSPDFRALRGLSVRARPGEPVQVKLTAYCLDGRTRRGTTTRPGVVAADTRIFPLTRHVELYAAGRHLGRFRVEDTGGAVRGPHIDIWTPDCTDARRFGTRAGVASLVAPARD